jgi:integrase/recombinase XerD
LLGPRISSKYKALLSITTLIETIMKDITDYLEKPQVDVMLKAATTTGNIRDYLIMQLLWRTGIRVNELLNIRPCDLEYHTNMVRIVKAKGDKQRRVPLDPETLAQLQAYIEANKIPGEAPIFPITQQWARASINKYAKLIGKNVHPHTFRHSFAINSVRHGVDIRRLQQVLGHSNINITAVYLQFNDKDVQEAYANVPF